MFITSSYNTDILKPVSSFMDWPGHKLLAQFPDHRLSSRDQEELEERFLTFHFLAPPAGQLEVLRQLVLRIRHFLGPRTGPHPMLFCPKLIAGGRIETLLERAKDNPWLVDAVFLDESESLEFLVLGANVVANPLFTQFFNNLTPHLTDAFLKEAIEVIRQHLVAKDINN